MDLNKLADIAKTFSEFNLDEKRHNWEQALYVKGFLQKQLPTLDEIQLAAVADYFAVMLGAIYQKPFCQVAEDIRITCYAYGIAAADLVGFIEHGNPPEPEAPKSPEFSGKPPETIFQPPEL